MTGKYRFPLSAAAQRERDHAALAMMKRMEAERRDRLSLVRIDPRTMVAGTSGAVAERMRVKHEAEESRERTLTRREQTMRERTAIMAKAFGGSAELPRRDIAANLRSLLGIGPKNAKATDKLIIHAEKNGIITRIPGCKTPVFRLNTDET